VRTEGKTKPNEFADEVLENLRTTLFTPKRWRLWHNFPQKLGALIAAIVLWFAATADRRATITRTYDVPLVLNGIDKSHVVTGQPKTVRVTLEADRTRLETLSVNLIEATADVSELDGFFTKPVTVNEPEGTRLIRTEPKQITGTLDEVVREQIEVRVALLESSAAPPLKVNVKPNEVTMIGPRPKIQQVAYALALATRQVGSNKSLEVRLTAVDSAGKPVEGVQLVPSRARISQ
jgi:YbbR domain-containing protein